MTQHMLQKLYCSSDNSTACGNYKKYVYENEQKQFTKH